MIVERDHMRIDPAYRVALADAGLATPGAILAMPGDRLVAWSRSSDTVFQLLAPSNLAVYVKRYHYPTLGKRMRVALRGGLLRDSRARAEYRILSAMRRWGIQAVRPVAWGERRLYGMVRSCFLVTEAVPEALSLATFIQRFSRDGLGLADDVAMAARRRILTQLARQVRFMHDSGFVHRDLFWRNVLIRPLPNLDFEFYFLDASVGRRIRVKQWRRDHVARDLAALGVLAPRFCSRADELRFIRAYFGAERIGEEEREWMERVQDETDVLRASEQERLARQGVFDRLAESPAA
ncbi:MAG: lipopolysaccharide kinase InaA family protein [Phycisphaerae bacterium]